MNNKPRYGVRYGIGPVYEVYDIETGATVESYRYGGRNHKQRELDRGIQHGRAVLAREFLNRKQQKGEA